MWCDYAPKYDVIRQLLEDGALGDLHTLLADHGEYFTRDHRIFNADLAGGPMMDLGSYVTSFALMVGGMPQEIVARGSATAEGLNGQTSMLFSWQNGMQGLLNTTLFSNTPGGAVVAGRRDPDDRRPVLRPRRLHARRQPGAGRCCAGKSRAIATTSCSGRRSILPGASDRGCRTRRCGRSVGCCRICR